MEDVVEGCSNYSSIDEDYEFDAPQFYDFTTEEFDSEIAEVERWFDFAGDYPPSPFIVKLNLENIVSSSTDADADADADFQPTSSQPKCSNRTKQTSNGSNTAPIPSRLVSKKDSKGKSPPIQLQESPKPKPDGKLSLGKSSSFMKPTASHLAKQKRVHDGGHGKGSSIHHKN